MKTANPKLGSCIVTILAEALVKTIALEDNWARSIPA